MNITNLQQWYLMLDEKSLQVKKYENSIYKYNKLLKINAEYSKPFMTGFYKKDKFSSHIFNIILSNFIKILICSGIISAILWIFLIVNKNVGVFYSIKQFGVTTIKSSIIAGVISIVLLSAVNVAFSYLFYKRIIKNLENSENDIYDIITTLPPNYRSFERMSAIAKVYFTKQSLEPDLVLEVCDEWIKHNKKRSITSVMFDSPFSNSFLINPTKVSSNNNETIMNEKPEKENQWLPDDIKSKTFAGSTNSDADLKEMIGLDSVKQQIEKLKNRMKFYSNGTNNGNHMSFMGGAGTGKTTVARIITKILYDLGYIKENKYVEISGDYLRAGNTARASAILDYSLGGVLFIDEAYLLYDKNGIGSEAIGVLLKAMEDHRQDFVCILAGYEEQMTRLIYSNEGFSSRIKHTIYFPDYESEEMYNIFTYFISNYNNRSYSINEEAKTALLDLFELEKKAKSFGNARTVRNAVDAIMDYYADRSIREKSNTKVIVLEDIKLYAEDRKRALQHELKNTSAANQLDESIIRLSELKSRLKNGSTDPETALNSLIGLESFKDEVNILKSQKEFYGQPIHQKILFIGDDGCGKSTVAEILTGYLYEFGYIQENKYLEIPAELLKGSYVGQTAKRAEAIISYASGGVLFIKNYNTLVNSNDSFSGEALSAISTAINENNEVTIILADYESDNINAIRNMFTIVYEFPIYTNEQLLQILDLQAYQQGFTIEEEARQLIYNYINQSQLEVRDIQQIYALTVKKHISNFTGDEDTKYTISKSDLVFNNIEAPRIKLNIKPKI